MDQLNPQQEAAVRQTEGAVRVIAGAGSGKTRTLISRYCYLVSDLGIAPRNILCVTFTNRAANVMKRRVRNKLGDLDLSLICTFHAFCVQFLKEEIHLLNFPKNFVILDAEDTKHLLQKVFTDLGLSLHDKTIQRAYDEVYEARKMCADAYIDEIRLLNNEQLKQRYESAEDLNDRIWYRYLYEQKKCFGCDFNDLINFTTYILANYEEVRTRWQNRMQYVMVDEFQDVSAKQYSIARYLSGIHGNLFIVGDPDQTIYSWRGSHMKMLLDFDKLYADSKTFTITLNYRSTPEILCASDTVIAHNTVRYPKTLEAVKPSSSKPLFFHATSEKQEAQWICDTICEAHRNGLPYESVAVLYRAHYLSRSLEECLIRKHIPYKIYSGIEFYGRREIKDAVGYLRMVTAADDLSFLRTVNTPSRRIGRKKLDELKEYAEKQGVSLFTAMRETLEQPIWKGTDARRYVDAIQFARDRQATLPLANLVQTLLDQSGYEEYMRLQGDQERLDNLAEFKHGVVRASEEEESTLEEFLARVALYTDLDREESKESIKLMTIHASKGMEFPVVFLCGLNEGTFPARKVETPEEMEEERRLAYVAMTRAEDKLFLSDSEGLTHDNLFKYPSRFLLEAGDTIEAIKPLDADLLERARKQIEQQEKRMMGEAAVMPIGTRVVHPVFGHGTILDVNVGESSYTIQFDGVKTHRTLLFSANLQRE